MEYLVLAFILVPLYLAVAVWLWIGLRNYNKEVEKALNDWYNNNVNDER